MDRSSYYYIHMLEKNKPSDMEETLRSYIEDYYMGTMQQIAQRGQAAAEQLQERYDYFFGVAANKYNNATGNLTDEAQIRQQFFDDIVKEVQSQLQIVDNTDLLGSAKKAYAGKGASGFNVQHWINRINKVRAELLALQAEAEAATSENDDYLRRIEQCISQGDELLETLGVDIESTEVTKRPRMKITGNQGLIDQINSFFNAFVVCAQYTNQFKAAVSEAIINMIIDNEEVTIAKIAEEAINGLVKGATKTQGNSTVTYTIDPQLRSFARLAKKIGGSTTINNVNGAMVISTRSKADGFFEEVQLTEGNSMKNVFLSIKATEPGGHYTQQGFDIQRYMPVSHILLQTSQEFIKAFINAVTYTKLGNTDTGRLKGRAEKAWDYLLQLAQYYALAGYNGASQQTNLINQFFIVQDFTTGRIKVHSIPALLANSLGDFGGSGLFNRSDDKYKNPLAGEDRLLEGKKDKMQGLERNRNLLEALFHKKLSINMKLNLSDFLGTSW